MFSLAKVTRNPKNSILKQNINVSKGPNDFSSLNDQKTIEFYYKLYDKSSPNIILGSQVELISKVKFPISSSNDSVCAITSLPLKNQIGIQIPYYICFSDFNTPFYEELNILPLLLEQLTISGGTDEEDNKGTLIAQALYVNPTNSITTAKSLVEYVVLSSSGIFLLAKSIDIIFLNDGERKITIRF